MAQASTRLQIPMQYAHTASMFLSAATVLRSCTQIESTTYDTPIGLLSSSTPPGNNSTHHERPQKQHPKQARPFERTELGKQLHSTITPNQ
eukprot:884136-Prymnesium_polylepis.2